jgi:gamma-glutamylcyclotransferase (GGCT)/AIG2-like uncharacterized protein YtfP
MTCNILYFAYGMLTNTEVMPGNSIRLGAATLFDYEREMLCYANVYESTNSSVEGILWLIDPNILDQLDYTEGYPTFYTRVERTVKFNGLSETAWVYTMTDESRARYKGSMPGTHYVNLVTQGLAEDGLSLDQ